METKWILLAIVGLSILVLSHQQDCPLDVVFIVDHSGTITSSAPQNNLYQNWNLMKTFLNNLLLRMRFGLQNTRLATVTFGDNSTVEFNLNTYTTISGASNAILNLDYMNGGRSNVSGAFRTTTDVILQAANGKRSGVPSICVLVVAFPPVLDATLTARERDRLKAVCRLVILGVGDPSRLNALRTEYQPYVNNAQTDLFTAAFLTLNNTDAVTPLINGITPLCPTTPTLSTIPTTSTTTPPPPTASRMFTKTTSRCLSTWNGRSTKKAPPKRKEVKSPADRPFWHRRRNYS